MSARTRSVIGGALAILACNAVGITGALFTSTDTAWYSALAKPSFQPPGWLFGPVWTLLYSMMGVAIYRVFQRRDQPGGRRAMTLFAVQLVLNGVWTPVFFGAGAITLALGVLLALWVALALTIRSFAAIDRVAAWLLAPYLLWVSFATVLNAAIVSLNT